MVRTWTRVPEEEGIGLVDRHRLHGGSGEYPQKRERGNERERETLPRSVIDFHARLIIFPRAKAAEIAGYFVLSAA